MRIEAILLSCLLLTPMIAGAQKNNNKGNLEMQAEYDPQKGVLSINDKPFFIYGLWGAFSPEEELDKKITIHYGFPKKGNKLPCMVYILKPQHLFKDKGRNPSEKDVLEHIRKNGLDKVTNDKVPAAIWFLGDDLSAKHRNIVKTAAGILRDYSKKNGAERVSAVDTWDGLKKYSKAVDMVWFYRYPLIFQPDLKMYRNWLVMKKELVSKNAHITPWIQGHMQNKYRYLAPQRNKIPYTGFLEPDIEQMRLIAYSTLQAGARGMMWFIHRTFYDKFFGGDKRAEVGIIGHEIDIVKEILAAGKPPVFIPSSDAEIEAALIKYKDMDLLIFNQYVPYDVNVVKDGIHKNVTVEIPLKAADGTEALKLNFLKPETIPIKPLKNGMSSITIDVDLTAMVLIAPKSRIEEYKGKLENAIPDIAGFESEALTWKLSKVEMIQYDLWNQGKVNAQNEKELMDARECAGKARKYLSDKKYMKAIEQARKGLHILRHIQYSEWKAALKNRNPLSNNYLLSYYQVPNFYRLEDRIRNGSFVNVIRNGDFSLGAEDWQLKGLAEMEENKDTKNKCVFLKRYTGEHCCEMEAENGSLLSGYHKVPGRAVIRVKGRIRIPLPLEEKTNPQRDCQIKLYWRKSSKDPKRFIPGLFYFDSTENGDWENFEFTRELPYDEKGEVAVHFLSRMNKGTFIDDVSLEVLKPETVKETKD